MMKTEEKKGVDSRVLSRILQEGYGPGAWHGADIKAAVAGVSAEASFLRSAPERHNIAEIALHHAYYVHSVRGRLTTVKPEPFALAGDDWFALEPVPKSTGSSLSWDDVQKVLETQYAKLATLLTDLGSGAAPAALDDDGALEVILGITCHSAYHAGQIQLIKALAEGRAAV